jgi:hypothetical protein
MKKCVLTDNWKCCLLKCASQELLFLILGLWWDWVQCYVAPDNGEEEDLVERELWGESKVLEENLKQYHFFHHKPHLNRSWLNLVWCGKKPVTRLWLCETLWALFCCGLQCCWYKSNRLWWLGLGVDKWGVRVQFPTCMKRCFSSPHLTDQLWAHPATYTVGALGYFMGDKTAGCEVDHSPASSAEMKSDGVVPTLLDTFSWCGA